MKLLAINKNTRDKIRGPFKRNHILEPVKIAKGVFILGLDDVVNIVCEIGKVKMLNLLVARGEIFTPGDGSNLDVKYQAYLIATSDL